MPAKGASAKDWFLVVLRLANYVDHSSCVALKPDYRAQYAYSNARLVFNNKPISEGPKGVLTVRTDRLAQRARLRASPFVELLRGCG